MAQSEKYPAAEALRVIDGPLKTELSIHRFDERTRSKAQLFATGGPLGRQFALVLGNTDVATGYHPAQQTRVVFEQCELPAITGLVPCDEPYEGSRIKTQQDSKLAAPNQVSCLMADESALTTLLRWYAGKPSPQKQSMVSLEHTRIEKAAADAGFDRSVVQEGNWLVFRSTAFPMFLGVAVLAGEQYRLGVSETSVGLRLAKEFGLEAIQEPGPWAVRLERLEGYACLHQALQRGARIAHTVAGEGARQFSAKTRKPPDTTEAVRLVVQRVGQDIFRKSLLDYWGGKCAVSGLDVAELLRASHIKPWAECETDGERLDVFNGLLLAPHLDALFDDGWITFTDAGELLVSEVLTSCQRALLALEGSAKVVGLTESHMAYLAWHRDNLFRQA